MLAGHSGGAGWFAIQGFAEQDPADAARGVECLMRESRPYSYSCYCYCYHYHCSHNHKAILLQAILLLLLSIIWYLYLHLEYLVRGTTHERQNKQCMGFGDRGTAPFPRVGSLFCLCVVHTTHMQKATGCIHLRGWKCWKGTKYFVNLQWNPCQVSIPGTSAAKSDFTAHGFTFMSLHNKGTRNILIFMINTQTLTKFWHSITPMLWYVDCRCTRGTCY